MIFALRPLQNDPDQENQAANNPKEDLGILGPFPIFHFAFSPISTASRASLSALRRLWFAWNSGSAWLSDIVCLDESGWRARRSSSSATCCSADRFDLIICFFPSARVRPGGGWLLNANQRVGWLVLPVFGLAASFARSACQASYSGVPRRGGASGGNPPIQCGMSAIWGPLAQAETNEQSAHSVKKVRSTVGNP